MSKSMQKTYKCKVKEQDKNVYEDFYLNQSFKHFTQSLGKGW